MTNTELCVSAGYVYRVKYREWVDSFKSYVEKSYPICEDGKESHLKSLKDRGCIDIELIKLK